MLNEILAAKLIERGKNRGADFVELFIEESRGTALTFKDQKVENATAGTEYGVGIRLIFGNEVLYAHTSDDREEILMQLIEDLAIGRTAASSPWDVGDWSQVNFDNAHQIIKDPKTISQEHKLPILQAANEYARSVSPLITQVAITAMDNVSQIQIFNSEGLWAKDNRTRARFSINVTAGEGGDRISAHEAPGAMRGFEFFETLNVEETSQNAAQRALRMLKADYISGKKMPVIMGNGFGGVIFHEACGHPLETESIRRNASPFCGKLGEQIAHESVTAIDDGTFANSWGSINIDDEGMPVQRTTLIENGILKSYMSDRVGASEVGVARTGSARRESYKYAPVSRMRNTFIANGKDTVEDMLSSVEEGLFAQKMGGGSVNPATGEFNFAVEEGYIIRNGKKAEAVRGATLIGKGHEILPKISMVANDFEMAAGMCGASSGSVPVTVGQPSLKVDDILVGGR